MVTRESIMEQRNPDGYSLPPDILDEILSWLPVKSLCRFKCVSKPWRDLVSDPGFVKRHRDRALQNEHVFYQRQRVIYTDLRLTPSDHKCRPHSIYSLDLNASTLAPTKLNHVFHERCIHELKWMSHCNGLLCCYLFGKGMYLLNPATRETKKVDRVRYLQDYGQVNYLYGFGFNDDDYKVVNGEIYVTDHVNLVTVFNVYSLRTSSWRRIDKLFPYNEPKSTFAILLNGGLHWLMSKLGYKSLVIVSFLLAEENVREIQLPVGHGIRDSKMVLGVYRGNKLFIADRRYTTNEIWVMMEYGVRKSWTKISVYIPHWSLSRFCSWNNSQDLYVDGKSLAMYNCNSNDEERFKNIISGIDKIGSVGMYFESLVSLNSQGGDAILHVPTPHIEAASHNDTSLDENHGGSSRDGGDDSDEDGSGSDSDSDSASYDSDSDSYDILFGFII